MQKIVDIDDEDNFCLSVMVNINARIGARAFEALLEKCLM